MSFFFQAEDGIRDVAVTGVQTCALPISLWQWTEITMFDAPGTRVRTSLISVWYSQGTVWPTVSGRFTEIGRASCRERVYMAGDAESVPKKNDECALAGEEMRRLSSLVRR